MAQDVVSAYVLIEKLKNGFLQEFRNTVNVMKNLIDNTYDFF